MASASSTLACPNVGRANTARQLPAIQPHNGCRVKGLSAPLLARQSNPSALLVKSRFGAAPLGQCTLGAHVRSQWRTYAAASDEPAEEGEVPAEDVAASGEADEGEWEEEYEFEEAEAILELSEDDLTNRSVLVKQIADISDSAGGLIETSAEEDKTQKESDELADVWLNTVMEVESLVADNDEETTDGKIELPFSDRGFFEEIHATLGELKLVQEVAKDFAPDTFDPAKVLYKHVPIDGTVTSYVDGLEQDLKMLDGFEVEDKDEFDEEEHKLLAVLDELHATSGNAPQGRNPLATLFNALEYKSYTAEEQQLLDSMKGKPDRALSAATVADLAPYVALTLEASGTPKPMDYLQSGATMLNKLVEVAGATPAAEWLHSATDSLSAARKEGELSAAEFEQLSAAVSDLQADLNGHTMQVDQGLFEVYNEKVAEVHKYGYPLPAPTASSGGEETDIAQLLKDGAAMYPELADAEMDAVLASLGESNEDEEDVEASILRAAKDLLEPEEYQAFLEEMDTHATEDELLEARDILVEVAQEQGTAAAAKVFGKLTVMAMSHVDAVDAVRLVEVPKVSPALAQFLPSAEESEKISQLAVGAQLFVSSADQITSQAVASDGWGPEAFLSDDDEVMQEYKNLKARYAEFNIDIDEHLAEPSISKQMRGGASASDIELTARILKNAAEGKSGADLLAGGPEGSARSSEEEKIIAMLKDMRDQDASFQEVYNMAEAGNWEGLDKPLAVPYTEKEQAILDMLEQQPGFSAEAQAAIKAAMEPVPLVELEEEEDALKKFLPVVDLSDAIVSDLESVKEEASTMSEPVTLEELAMRSEVDQMYEGDEEEQVEEPVAEELAADTPFDSSMEGTMMDVDPETLAAEVSARMGDIVEDDEAEDGVDAAAAFAHAQGLMAQFEAMEGARTEDGELTEAAMAKFAEAQAAFEAAKEAADPDVAAWREAAEQVSLEIARDSAVRAEADAAGINLPPSVDPDMDEDEAIDFMQAFAKQMEEVVEAATAQSAKVSSIEAALAASSTGEMPEMDVDALEAELKAMLGSEKAAEAEAAAADVDLTQVLAAAQPGASAASERAALQATLALTFTNEELEELDSQAAMVDEEDDEDEAAEEVDPMDELEALLGPVSALQSRSAEAEAEEGEDEVEVAEGEDDLDEGVVTFDGLIAEVVDALEEVADDDDEAEYLELQGDEADEADADDEDIVASNADDDDEEDDEVDDDDEEDEEAFGIQAEYGEADEGEGAMYDEEADEEDEYEFGDADDEGMEMMDALQEDDEEGADTDEGQAAIQAALESQFYDGLEVDEEEAEEEVDLDEDQGAAAQEEDGPGATDNDDELSTEYNTMESELLVPTFDDIWEEMGVVELRPKEPVRPRPEVEASAGDADEELDEDAARDELDDDDYEEEEAFEGEVEDDPIAKYYAKGEDEEDETEDDGTDNAYALTSGLALFGESPTLGDDEDRAADDATGLLERVTVSKAGDVFVERIIQVGRVTKVVKGGKIMSFRCVAVVGNKNGCVGVGVDSAREVVQAVQKAVTAAKKNLVVVPLTKSDSIPHRVEAKYKSAACVINPAGEGTGCIAGGAVRSVLELAGVKNVLAKRLGSRNPLNNARATVRALEQLQTWGEVAGKRDVSLEYLFAQNSADSERAYAATRGASKDDETL